MHKCKYCGAQLSKLDKDICPFCGGLKPLEGLNDETEDITKSLESLSFEEKESLGEPKSKLIAFFLTLFLGIFGIHSFYLGFKRVGLITLGITVTFIAGFGSILFFSEAIHNALAFFIPYFVLEGFMIVVSLMYLLRSDVKDARGEFLR